MLRKREKRLGLLPNQKEGSFVCVVTENGQHNPLTWREPAKTSKLLLAGNAATHTKKLRKFMFFNRNFLHTNFRKFMMIYDLSKSVSNQNLNMNITENEKGKR
jgi:hypothetical protein